jgi:SAM-dependent methyltransferase
VLLEAIVPHSVADIGCGIGGWLAVFLEHGIEDILGIDGAYVNRDELVIPREAFLAHDLNQPLVLDRWFDLALCLEVGEHLDARSSATLVASLTALAPVVVFSAAIPGQSGVGHVTLRWPDYWTALFGAQSFRPVDFVRPRIWDDAEVEPWYRQNIVVYAHERAYARLTELAVPFPPAATLIHREIYRHAVPITPPPARELLRQLPGATRRALHPWLARAREAGRRVRSSAR